MSGVVEYDLVPGLLSPLRPQGLTPVCCDKGDV